MKDFPILLITGIILLSVPIFLPYMEYDIREFHGLFSFKPRNIIAKDQILYGSQTGLSYFPIILLLFPISLTLRKKSKANAHMLLIFAILMLIIMVGLYFALTADPSFYNGYENVRLKLGFWCSFVGTILFFVGSIQMLSTKLIKPDKQTKVKDSDLLDDSI